ncbi:peptidyl-prolyl cis-trans isomerase, FKBP-type domain protein [Verrucomicrobiia bacterium DG1235]|nr:peptidyl-prolyl cis-trans isomerase, FKBP-type domain protein [Verrucomicrobiae bacterium DG1235]
MKKLLAFATVFAVTLSSFGQLADMIDLPEEMGAEEPKYTDEELLRSWGWLLAERFNLKDLELNRTEMDWISAGLLSHVEGEEAPTNLRDSQFAMQEYFAKREVTIRSRQLVENRRKEEEFFDTLFGLPDVQSLGTGLFYQILEAGSDVRPDASDTVVVRYEGRFLDNTVFDSTEDKGPAALKLREVIDGWTQGIPLIGEGGKIKLFVPSKLGYGDEGRPGVPPASTLVFEIELLKVGLPEDPAAEGVNVFEPSEEDFVE